jgi:hypothetical protein
MNVDTDQFRAIQAEALEVSAIRRGLVLNELMVREIEARAEDRGFKRGWAAGRRVAGRHARPRDAQRGNLRLVAGGGQ